jgi:Flp pilus assembly protein TadD
MAPDDADLRRTRALLLGDLGRYEEAIADFDRLLAVQPHNPDLLLLKGIALYRLAQFRESLQACDEAALFLPDDPTIHAMRGYALDALGRHQDAIVAFDRSLTIEGSQHVAGARKAVLDSYLRGLVDIGFGSWSGGKPKGSKKPAKLSPGPSITELVHEGRR